MRFVREIEGLDLTGFCGCKAFIAEAHLGRNKALPSKCGLSVTCDLTGSGLGALKKYDKYE
jgi:hypothetical protein